MSAINEWFGYYNAIFCYIERTYGKEERKRYLAYLARVPNADVAEAYRLGGLEAIRSRYERNFRKDGDEHSVVTETEGETLRMRVRCPAFYNAPAAGHRDRQAGPFLCECCKELNAGILREAGYDLTVEQEQPGDCAWRIRKAEETI